MAERKHTMKDRLQELNRFYELIYQLHDQLGGWPYLKDCHGRQNWPRRGVYFFLDDHETRETNPQQLRVVRVGTHAVSTGSKSTLWNRLRSHRGTNKGTGNHRGSIFRLHTGMAMQNSPNSNWNVPTWGKGNNAPREVKDTEQELEKAVSTYLGDLPFVWVDIDDEPSALSHRSLVEKNSIILLAGEDGTSPLDKPSSNWLGNYSVRPKIRNSGLWNLDYVGTDDKTYTYNPEFMNIFAEYVQNTHR